MQLELHKHRIITPIATIEEAIEIAKTLCGGDFGLIVVTFDSPKERGEFRDKYKINNQGEWRFITKRKRYEKKTK